MARLPESVLACLREAEAEDDATIDFIREAALNGEGSREDLLEELGDLLDSFGAKDLAAEVLDWADQQKASEEQGQAQSRSAAADLVQELIAADAAELQAKASQAADTASPTTSADPDKEAVLRALSQYEQSAGKSGAGDDAEVVNANRLAAMEHHKAEAAARAAMSAAHAAKVAKDKADTAAAKAKRQEAKKKAQERSKGNESRRGG
eukprot:CAMPEP_0178383576 /NCGR_PEP_ID=MMETSP0689_2-20121128/7072_1 /TAXON_ID=160604 /ORGANISM="Amphidinium massartii, Strain CS-259" /LENGTH=207 /DNA_ID=CAMNT_0020003799 /DNA_START=96 /DNA_END=716 /DNA_ORIENTATION=+